MEGQTRSCSGTGGEYKEAFVISGDEKASDRVGSLMRDGVFVRVRSKIRRT